MFQSILTSIKNLFSIVFPHRIKHYCMVISAGSIFFLIYFYTVFLLGNLTKKFGFLIYIPTLFYFLF